MNEESADASWVVCRVERVVLADSAAVAAKDCATTTPTAATDDMTGMLDGKVSAVADKLAVNAEDWAECSLHLRG